MFFREDNRGNEDNINRQICECIEALSLFRGMMTNTSIIDLEINMDLFSCDGSLPSLNLQDAQFKEWFKYLRLKGDYHIDDNQSDMSTDKF